MTDGLKAVSGILHFVRRDGLKAVSGEVDDRTICDIP